MSTEDPGIWRELLSGIGAVITAIFAWMFKDVHERIKEAKRIAEEKVSKVDFDAHLERNLEDRRNIRAEVKELFSRDECLKDIMNKRFEELHRDMSGGFERLSREICARRD